VCTIDKGVRTISASIPLRTATEKLLPEGAGVR
jgi:hypothetical protein